MSDDPARRKLEEIFGDDSSWSEPKDDSDAQDERRREQEYLENRPPHHEDR